MSKRPMRLMAGLAAVAFLASACGSSSASSSTSTTVKANGTPIVVGEIVPMTGPNLALPAVGNGVTASIDALNNAGGINGHPIKLIQCDSMGDAATEVQCAQSLVSSHVVATLEDYTFASPAEDNQILAGIPRIGIQMFDTSDYANPANFDFTAGGLFTIAGEVDALINKGDKKLTVMLPDAATAGQLHLLLDPIVEAQGAKVVNYVLVSSASGDYSQYVEQAEQNGAQGIASALGNAQLVQFAETFNQLKPNIDVSTGIGSFTLNQLKQLTPFTEKAIFPSWTPGIDDVKNFPGLAQPLAQLTANQKGVTVNNLGTLELQSWLAVHAFYEVVKAQTGTPTAASILAAFTAAKDIPMNGIIKPWSPGVYVSAGTTYGSVFKNVSNVYQYVVKFNGTNTTTNTSTLFSTFAGLPGTTTGK